MKKMMSNQGGKRRFSLTGILLLLIILLGGFFTGGIAESRTDFGKTEAYKAESAAKKKITTTNTEASEKKEENSEETDEIKVEEDGEYTSREEVAAYIHEFGCLPSNFITKREAQDLGWDNKRGNLDEAAPGKSIGGDKFGNYEELLPVKKGRRYYECDIDYEGGYRGAKRIIFSNDGLIFYTEDHYKTFEPLYDQNGKVEKK